MTKTEPGPESGPRTGKTFTKVIRKLLPWLMAAVLFVLLFRRVPLDRVIEEFRNLTTGQIAGLSVLSLVFIVGVSMLDGTAMWYGFSRFKVRIRWKEIVLVRAAMMLLASLATPIGQAGLAAHVARKHKVSAGPAAGMVMYLFLIEAYGMVAVATVSLPALVLLGGVEIGAGAPLVPALVMIGLAWPALVALVFLGRKAAGARLMQKLRLAGLLHPLNSISNGELIKVLGLKTGLAFWQILLTVAAFRIYGIRAPAGDLFAFMPLAILVSSIPIAPGRLGITQVSWVFFFRYLAPEPALVALSLLLQFLLNVARWLIGAAVLPFIYGELGGAGVGSGRDPLEPGDGFSDE